MPKRRGSLPTASWQPCATDRRMPTARWAPALVAGALFLLGTAPVTQAAPGPDESAAGWHALLHFAPDGTRPATRDPDFYLHHFEDRPTPEAEYLAATERFFLARDREAICDFPARYEWLRQQQGRTAQPVEELCELPEPVDELRMAFPSAFVGSAASLFGHLFLVFEREEQPLLLSETVDFAADVPVGTGGWDYVIGGIRGDFPGQVVTQPLHERIHKYSHQERRDIWLYDMDLSEETRRLLVLHLEETRRIAFPYRFFSDNCGYRTLVLLDAARGTADRERLGLTSAPAEILRHLDDGGILTNPELIPAADTRLAEYGRELDRETRRRAHRAVREDELPDADWLAEHPEAAAYLHAWHLDMHRRVSARQATLDQLTPHLADRDLSRPAGDSVWDPRGVQPYQRITTAAWQGQDRSAARISLFPGYHALLDRPRGYEPGYALSLLQLDALVDSEGRTEIERFLPLRLRNYHNFGALSRRPSVGLDVSWQRRADGPARGRSFGRLEGFSGAAFQRDGLTVLGALGATLEISGSGGGDSRLLSGPRGDLVYRYGGLALNLAAGRYGDLTGSGDSLAFAEAGVSWYPWRSLGLGVDYRRESGRFPERSRSLGLRWHF